MFYKYELFYKYFLQYTYERKSDMHICVHVHSLAVNQMQLCYKWLLSDSSHP
jgi:hypothetical protein